MHGLLQVLAVALLPVAGNVLGSALAELTRAPRWVVGAALHGAAGVAIALVSIELMPRVRYTSPMWFVVLLFAAGALLSLLLVRMVEAMRRRSPQASTGAWMVYAATSIDLLSDGLMTGASAAVSSELGLLFALSQVVANIPGGFATIANFRLQEVSRTIRLTAAASFAIPVVLGAALGYWLLQGAAEWLQDAALAIVIGVLLVSTIEDLVPQADEPGTARWLSTTSFVAGFAFFALLSAYLE